MSENKKVAQNIRNEQKCDQQPIKVVLSLT